MKKNTLSKFALVPMLSCTKSDAIEVDTCALNTTIQINENNLANRNINGSAGEMSLLVWFFITLSIQEVLPMTYDLIITPILQTDQLSMNL